MGTDDTCPQGPLSLLERKVEVAVRIGRYKFWNCKIKKLYRDDTKILVHDSTNSTNFFVVLYIVCSLYLMIGFSF